jgi:hypothetical protein
VSKTSSYGPDRLLVGFWALVCSPPALATGYLLFKAPSYGSLIQFASTLAFPLLPIIFASRFRATFAPTEFIYRRWGPTICIPLADIDRIEVANVTPFTKEPIGAFVVTRKGQRLPFWPKLFPREAVRRFFALAS